MLKNLFNLEFATDKSHSFTERKPAIIAISSLCAVILIVLSAWIIIFAVPSIKYSHALNLSNFDSNKAVTVINTLPDDYKDSNILKKYINAINLKDNGRYNDAINEFSQLGEYRNTKEYIAETRYLYAVELLNQGEYDTAYDMFMYSKHRDYLMQSYETVYLAGENATDPYTSAEYYSRIFHYKDSKDKYFFKMYTHAEDLIKNNDKALAAQTLNEMNSQGNYLNSLSLERRLWYECATEKAAIGNYKSAIRYITMAVDYPSTAEVEKLFTDYTNEYHYIKGSDEMANENYSVALEHFEKIKGYKDSDELLYQCEKLAYPWVFTGFLSMDKTEATKTTEFLSTDDICVTGILTGGKPEKTVTLVFTCSDARRRTSVHVYEGWTANTHGGCIFTFSHPQNAAEGTGTITVEIGETGEIIGTFDFNVTVAD